MDMDNGHFFSFKTKWAPEKAHNQYWETVMEGGRRFQSFTQPEYDIFTQPEYDFPKEKEKILTIRS